jgi:hypothetical protein
MKYFLVALFGGCIGVYSDPGHSRDGSIDSSHDAAPDGSQQVTGIKHVFTTSTTYQGGALGGLAGADQKCADRAHAATLPGTFKAWLSDHTISARGRLTQSVDGYVLVGGTRVAATWDVLVSATLANAIDLDETGQMITGPSTCAVVGGLVPAWTGTEADGSYAVSENNCGDWTELEHGGLIGNGVVGDISKSNSKWTSSLCAPSCTYAAALYCIEQ